MFGLFYEICKINLICMIIGLLKMNGLANIIGRGKINGRGKMYRHLGFSLFFFIFSQGSQIARLPHHSEEKKRK